MGLGRATDRTAAPRSPRRPAAGRMSDVGCKSLWRRAWEHVSVRLDEGTEFSGSAEEVAAKLATDDDALASALLAQAEKTAAEPHERADGAERRATTLQGAVAIAASFGLASS